MASEQFSLCWDNFHKNMSSGMNSLLESEDLVDVTLAVQGKCLKAHKMVLSVCSPYFKELFKSNPCQHPIVFMKDVSYEALSDLLQFMYQGEVQVSQENLTTFIKTAEALQIKGLTADGNGSAENETSETPEKPQRHVEEYKPMPRPKKQPAPAIAPSPPVKRSRLSSDTQSTALVASTPLAKQESSASASIGSTNLSQPEQVHFKMEPYDQSSGMLDETGDEAFGDDTLDDTAVDDTEDYSMMEGGVGESDGGEPQAGTSGADGTGEGQDLQCFLETTKGLSNNGIVVDGFTYHQNITKEKSGTRYLICAEYKRLVCRARAIIPLGGTAEDLVLKKEHNHPPMKDVMVKKTFVKTLKKLIADKIDMPLKYIYDIAVHCYLRCSQQKKNGCRARASIPVGGSIEQLKVTKGHNHPPDPNAEEKEAFLVEMKQALRSASMEGVALKRVYETVAEAFPRAAYEIPFKSVRSSMHRWRKNLWM